MATQHESQDQSYARSPEEVLRVLEVSREGLRQDEVIARQRSFGPNRLPEARRRSPVLRFLGHFNNILIYILLASAVVKAAYRDWIDFWVIFVVALATGLIGFLQEGQAERALAGIRRMLSLHATVLRDGEWSDVVAEELVPGDIVRLRPGDRVPADLRLLTVEGLEIDESPLTGESVLAVKGTGAVPIGAVLGDRVGMAFSGTVVGAGTGIGMVAATGSDTELGRIQTLIDEADPLGTPLTGQLDRLGKRIAAFILVLAGVMTVVGLLLHGDGPEQLLDSAITFAVAAVPEGLPAIVTITLALGVRQMAQRNAITRKLTAVETLGEVTTICSDKTGTLTYNEMTVRSLVTSVGRYSITGVGYSPEGHAVSEHSGEAASFHERRDLHELVIALSRCTDAAVQKTDDGWSVVGAPTEGSLVVLARKAEFTGEGYQRTAELPFNSKNKLMAVLDRSPDGSVRLIAKGAPDRLLDRCAYQLDANGEKTPLRREEWDDAVDSLGRQGLRVLAAAAAPSFGASTIGLGDVHSLTLLGLVAIADPPRAEAIEAIRRCREAGIRVTMITGDHASTASAIAAELGIAGRSFPRVVTGAELQVMSDVDLADIAPTVDVFARTNPEHKIRIVRALQSRRQVVAMTGDGVNDAPALTRADIGIAMGINGTEATKEAADIVLADDDFATIERAVAEGRRIFDNIQKSLMFILPTTFAQALIVLTAVIIGFVPPLQPTQVLWVNLVTAITLSLALAYEPGEQGLMSRPPRAVTSSMIDGILIARITVVTLLITAASIGIFFVELGSGSSFAIAQTSAVTVLVLGQVAYLFNSRFLRVSSFSLRALRGNPVVWVSVGILLLLQLAFTYVPAMQEWFHTAPLRWREWGIALSLAVAIFLIVEVEKAIARAARKRRKP
ncbi:cation-translocating P-type ATPase [Microbacterium forte]